ncbi:MAG: flagellar basal body protein [Acutalibacteraceae bacterium]|nr:flagellar basal body protein [Acutalibacteraceae bacterium]
MVRGLYTAYTGMLNEQKRLDIISNNLANSSTVGYKAENVTSQSFKDLMTIKVRDGSCAYNEEMIDDALAAFDRVFDNIVCLEK